MLFLGGVLAATPPAHHQEIYCLGAALPPPDPYAGKRYLPLSAQSVGVWGGFAAPENPFCGPGALAKLAHLAHQERILEHSPSKPLCESDCVSRITTASYSLPDI